MDNKNQIELISIESARKLSKEVLSKLGFQISECKLITQNLIEAELAERKTHGLMRLKEIGELVNTKKVTPSEDDIKVINEHKASLHIDCRYKPGFYAIYRSLDIAFKKVEDSGIVVVALKNFTNASGYMGDYARMAVEKDLVFISFNTSSPARLVPHGSIQRLWGTNPIVIGIPSLKIPVILDMSTSVTPWGNVMLAKNENNNLEHGVAVDSEGNITISPEEAMNGGLLPLGGHKGSGLAFVGELLGGALTNSKVGDQAVRGGWGTLYILIDPSIFRNVEDFKSDVQKAIDELKMSKKAPNVDDIYFPGERTYIKRQKNIEKGIIEISTKLKGELESMSV